MEQNAALGKREGEGRVGEGGREGGRKVSKDPGWHAILPPCTRTGQAGRREGGKGRIALVSPGVVVRRVSQIRRNLSG